MSRSLYTYEYVEASFEDVSKLLRDAPEQVLHPAADAAASHAHEVHRTLVVDLGRVEVARDITVEIGAFEPVETHRHKLALRWQATQDPGLFPQMAGHLEAIAMSTHPPLTQLSFVGEYVAPMGPLGAAGDAVLGHRFAELAIDRFVKEVAARIEELAATPPAVATA